MVEKKYQDDVEFISDSSFDNSIKINAKQKSIKDRPDEQQIMSKQIVKVVCKYKIIFLFVYIYNSLKFQLVYHLKIKIYYQNVFLQWVY